MQKPFPQSYWVIDGLFCAGQYPGSMESGERDAKLKGLVDCGIRRVINLIPVTETGRYGEAFSDYQSLLEKFSAQEGRTVDFVRLGYSDGSTPAREHMTTLLNTIDASLAANEPLYLHCWGGHGRTGTTVACYLIRHGLTPQEAIDQIGAWRQPLPNNWYAFEGEQESFVRSWRDGE